MEESKASVDSGGVNYIQREHKSNNDNMNNEKECMCESRREDEAEKKKMHAEISLVYEEII